MDENLKDIIKLSIEIFFDKIEKAIKKVRSKNAIYLHSIDNINFYDVSDKRIIYYDSKSKISYKNFNEIFPKRYDTAIGEGLYALNFNSENLVFKFKILNKTCDDVLIELDNVIEEIKINENKELYCVINKDCLNCDCFCIRLNYFFSKKGKVKTINYVVNFTKNNIYNVDDYYEIIN